MSTTTNTPNLTTPDNPADHGWQEHCDSCTGSGCPNVAAEFMMPAPVLLRRARGEAQPPEQIRKMLADYMSLNHTNFEVWGTEYTVGQPAQVVPDPIGEPLTEAQARQAAGPDGSIDVVVAATLTDLTCLGSDAINDLLSALVVGDESALEDIDERAVGVSGDGLSVHLRVSGNLRDWFARLDEQRADEHPHAHGDYSDAN